MKNYDLYIGVDVSKKKLDMVGIDDENQEQVRHQVILNDKKSIRTYFKSILKKEQNKVIVGFENTGVYGTLLAIELNELEIDFIQLPSLEVSRSRGISRGKSDKIDALQIAQYLLSHRFKLKCSTIKENDLSKLQVLYSQREKIVKSISQYQRNFESTDYLPKEMLEDMIKTTKSILKNLNKNLKLIEKKITEIILGNKAIDQNFKLIISIPGIGKQTAIYLIIVTHNFTSFNTARELACYAGIAPFPYQSGSSIKGRTKVNNLANKKLKSLLNMCALTAKKYDFELNEYYNKKVEEGKNKMLVLNNVRNKLLGRIFSVVNRQQPYVNTRKFAA